MKRKVVMVAALAWLSLNAALSNGTQAAEALNVVVTIKPIHSLTIAVMQGAGTPRLLIAGANSPHSYALKPSDATSLNRANIVVRVSENLETFLEKPIESLSKEATVVTLSESPGLELLPVRKGGVFEAHDHGDGHEHKNNQENNGKSAGAGNHHEGYDAHFWLSPVNAAAIAEHLASVFAKAQPENAARFKANAERLKQRLARLDTELQRTLAPVKGKPFIVFHDAYQYFEDHYGLKAVGSITLSPERQPGAARLKQIRAKITETRSICVFSEPQFKPKLLETVTEGTDAKSAVLDPLGVSLPEGADQYFQLMIDLAKSLNDCLAGLA